MDCNFRVGIIGGGFVGKATKTLFGSTSIVYDLQEELCQPRTCTWEHILACDVVCICVPTPMNTTTGECHSSIVENVVRRLRDANYLGHVVIRSTVPVGTSDKLQCHFFPEFLTEKNWEYDVRECPQWIIGSHDKMFIQKISSLIDRSFLEGNIKSIRVVQVTPPIAETVKLFRNTFLATKIAFCNEWYRFCEKNNLDYETMRKVATADTRIGASHSHVPGHDNRTGFGGTCFPKDIASAIHQFHSVEVFCPVLTAVHTRNNEIDRPDHDWVTNVGRAVIHME